MNAPTEALVVPHDHEDMTERWSEVQRAWLIDHPVMDAPSGFEIDPSGIGPMWPDQGPEPADGWMLSQAGDDRLVRHEFADVAGARELVVTLAAEDPRVSLIQLWDNGDCVWAARRLEITSAR